MSDGGPGVRGAGLGAVPVGVEGLAVRPRADDTPGHPLGLVLVGGEGPEVRPPGGVLQ